MGRVKNFSSLGTTSSSFDVGQVLPIDLTDILNKRGISNTLLVSEKSFSLKWQTLNTAVSLTKGYLLNYNQFGVLYDVDVDGLVSGKQIEETLKNLGVIVHRFMNSRKKHGLNQTVLDWAIREKLEVLFIVDAGTNDIEWHKKFSENGIKLIVLDHHEQWEKETVKDVCIVNCSVDEGGNLPKLSGAGVCYRFIELLDRELKGKGVTHYEPWVGLTVLSDQCSMVDAENRYYIDALYNNYTNIPLFNCFKFYGSHRNLFVYSVIPFLNACIRMNEVDIAMNVVSNLEKGKISRYVNENREYVLGKQSSQMEDMAKTSRFLHGKEIVLVRLENDKVQYSGLTGLFANKIMSKTNKAVIVMYDDNGVFRGSFRGKQALTREVLESLGWKVMGHTYAAGIELQRDVAKQTINDSLAYENTLEGPKASYDFELRDKDVVINLPFLEKAARFNERASGDVDTIKFKLNISRNPFKEDYGKYSVYNFLSFEVRDFDTNREENDDWIIEMSLNNKGISLMRV